LDFADDAEADTRQATDLSDAGAKVFQLFDDEDTAGQTLCVLASA